VKTCQVYWLRVGMALAVCRREVKPSQLLAWIAKSRLKQGKKSLEIARIGNLAKPKGNFSGFSDSLLGLVAPHLMSL